MCSWDQNAAWYNTDIHWSLCLCKQQKTIHRTTTACEKHQTRQRVTLLVDEMSYWELDSWCQNDVVSISIVVCTTFCTKIAHCFHGPSDIVFIRSYLVEHSSSSATALITDTRTVQMFAQGVIVCVIVTARPLVTVLCYLCVLKCLFIIIIFF